MGEAWALRWRFALEERFPKRGPALAASLGDGLRALLDDGTFAEAWHCCNVGLLKGKGVIERQVKGIAHQALADAIEPEERAGRRAHVSA